MAAARIVTPIASHAERDPDSTVSGTPTRTRPPCTMRRQRGDSMRPASAHAGQITNGGTATEPNGVASPGSRIGGMPGAPTSTHSMRRTTRLTRVGTDRTSTGTAVTMPTHDGR